MTEKRFPPSPERIVKARREGKVAQSQLLTSACGMVVLLPVISLTVPWVRDGTLIQWLSYKVLSPGDAFAEAIGTAFSLSAAVLSAVGVGAVSAHVFQTRGLFCFSKIGTGYRRIGPRSYGGRVKDALKDAPIGVLRATAVVLISGPVIVGYVGTSAYLVASSAQLVERVTVDALLGVCVRAVSVIGALGAVAYMGARLRLHKELRMTLEEVKQEQRDDQGDPHMRALRKHEALSLSMADLERRVKMSKVVIVRRKAPSNGHRE